MDEVGDTREHDETGGEPEPSFEGDVDAGVVSPREGPGAGPVEEAERSEVAGRGGAKRRAREMGGDDDDAGGAHESAKRQATGREILYRIICPVRSTGGVIGKARRCCTFVLFAAAFSHLMHLPYLPWY